MDFIEADSDEENAIGFWHTKADFDSAFMGFTGRITDVGREPLFRDIPAVIGLANTPLVSLHEAVESLVDLVPHIEDCFEQTVQYTNQLKALPESIEEDDFRVLLLCTWPWEDLKENKTLYHMFNRKLRLSDRHVLQPYLPLLKLFLTVLYKLPCYHGTVWGGTRQDVSSLYREDQRLTWWGFSSFVEKLSVLNQPNVLGKFGIKTLFNLHTTRGFKFDLIPDVGEVIIPPGLQMKVLNIYNAGQGVKIIELQEIISEIPTVDFPRAVYELGSEEFFLRRLEDFSTSGQWDKFVSTVKSLPLNKEAYLYEASFQSFCQGADNGDLTVPVQEEDVLDMITLVIHAMKFHPGNKSLQRSGCLMLQAMGARDFRDEDVGQELIQTLTVVLSEHSNDSELQILASSVLSPMLHNHRNRLCGARYGLLDTLPKYLELHREDGVVCQNMFRLLALLCISEDNTVRLNSEENISLIFRSLEAHSDNPLVVEQGILLLSRLLLNDSSLINNPHYGGIETVLGAMKRHPSCPSVLQNCCLCLSRFAQNSRNKENIGIQGGVTQILSVIFNNQSHRQIQRNGCLALTELVSSTENLLTFLKEDGVQTVLKLMQQHADAESIQEAACGVLAVLCEKWNNLSSINKTQLMGVLNEVPIRHFDHRGVQSKSCEALAHIWGNKDEVTDEKLSTPESKNAIRAILRSVTCHYDHATTLEYGFLALARVCEIQSARDVIRDGGGIEIALEALRAQKERPVIQLNILTMLAGLSRNPQCQALIAENDGTVQIAKTLIRRSHSGETQGCGCCILSRMAANCDNHKLLQIPIVSEAMTKAKHNWSQNEQVFKYVTKFFQRMEKKKI